MMMLNSINEDVWSSILIFRKEYCWLEEYFWFASFLSDSQAIHEDSLSSILLIELNSLFSLICFTRMSWFSWSSELCVLSEW